ncbi:hypothetical protein EMIT0111MI5_40234 [Burkholderia sp. IT-111MI5]
MTARVNGHASSHASRGPRRRMRAIRATVRVVFPHPSYGYLRKGHGKKIVTVRAACRRKRRLERIGMKGGVTTSEVSNAQDDSLFDETRRMQFLRLGRSIVKRRNTLSKRCCRE